MSELLNSYKTAQEEIKKTDENGKIYNVGACANYYNVNDMIEGFNYIINNLYDNTVDFLHNAEVLADEIDGFLDSQCDIFEDYIAYYEEELEEEQKQERNEKAKNNAILYSIFTKYAITEEERNTILASA